jgi:hypothetical protein
MKTIIKNTLEHLGEKGMRVTIQMDNCKVCLNNRNVKDTYRYHETYLSDTYNSYQIKYTDLVVDKGFTHALAVYINNFAPRSKSKPKIVWPEGMLKYTKLEEMEEDMQALFSSSMQDDTLQEFYNKNLLPNVKK